MADFKLALKKGLDAAEKAEANRKEIESVIEELNKQLQEDTDGKLEIIQDLDYADTSAAVRAAIFIGGLSGAVGMGNNAAHLQKVNYLSCRNPRSENKNKLRLSEFKVGRAGYPCELKVGDEEMFCEDKQALEQALSYLLSDPVAADKMYKVMQYKVTYAESDGSESKDS
ncbi:hypothetical protein [Pseudomonas tremae]|uniref:hypothetical protein n=1 Tax=Pseudomonas tremae TaxID=200454 RepID=UPI001F22DC32|nr:hypothetical protein [Pseudomonas tremae]MCF5747103.1 hypothetical protein [Pseudomonas tremae]UQB36589.1 hypothetical protein I9H09_24385 [Pseudomonas tremae]